MILISHAKTPSRYWLFFDRSTRHQRQITRFTRCDLIIWSQPTTLGLGSDHSNQRAQIKGLKSMGAALKRVEVMCSNGRSPMNLSYDWVSPELDQCVSHDELVDERSFTEKTWALKPMIIAWLYSKLYRSMSECICVLTLHITYTIVWWLSISSRLKQEDP